MGLESWRQLNRQFNPITIQSTLTSQQLELKPKGASKLSEMPGALLAWEANLRKRTDEGREQPSDELKRLALLRMLPPKIRQSIWGSLRSCTPLLVIF